ncbi:MAG: hypothetical protein QF362_00420 [Candidatus Woesearchaeota archaeon]|jgi:hypothetical protein|nr:hypothetical protein [Candidatus Woesearchaeota archaeon]MDP7610285.1 hypothetical protein [Candidatus Woesearchaeota archaeon]|tara:strand:+ start:712 stop:1623 length:912 start_codon:yes stop_codon:yes gene_type:complete
MSLLNHLFGSKKSTVKELVMDDNKRMALWNKHIANSKLRENLSKHFNFKNVDNALQDFKATDKILRELESLISPELINIANEEKTDEEILADLEQLKSTNELEKLSKTILSVKQKQSTLLKLFHEIFNVLKAELHLIHLIRKKPSKALLLKLFELIFRSEPELYRVFREQSFFGENKHIHTSIMKIARAILLEEEVKEELESDEEKFVREIAQQMHPDESRRRYRKLGEDIFLTLTEMADESLPKGEDITERMKLINRIMKKDEIMYKIVKKLRPKYDETKIKAVILAFRKAYNLGHFDELDF